MVTPVRRMQYTQVPHRSWIVSPLFMKKLITHRDTTMVRKKKAANHKPIKKLNKQLMLVAIKYVVEQIIVEKEKNNGRVPWGFAARLLAHGIAVLQESKQTVKQL